MDGYLILMNDATNGTCVVAREALEEKAEQRAKALNKRAKHGVQYFVAQVRTMAARMADKDEDVMIDAGLAVPEGEPVTA